MHILLMLYESVVDFNCVLNVDRILIEVILPVFCCSAFSDFIKMFSVVWYILFVLYVLLLSAFVVSSLTVPW